MYHSMYILYSLSSKENFKTCTIISKKSDIFVCSRKRNETQNIKLWQSKLEWSKLKSKIQFYALFLYSIFQKFLEILMFINFHIDWSYIYSFFFCKH